MTWLGHAPVRPHWACRVCETDWPCGPARSVLLVDHAHDRLSLAIHLALLMRIAVGDVYRSGGRPDLAGLHVRFLGWLTRSAVVR